MVTIGLIAINVVAFLLSFSNIEDSAHQPQK